MTSPAPTAPGNVGQRIVSLLPSATEIVYALGLDDALVGVTFECDYPADARTKRVVSDTSLPPGLSPAEIDQAVTERTDAHESIYTLDEGALRALNPDLVLTQDLCAVCAVDVSEVTDALDHLGCHAHVLTLDPQTLDEVLTDIQTVADVTGRPERGRDCIAALRDRLARVRAAVNGLPRPPVFVLEWTDPPFNAGHWLPDMVSVAGGEPVLARAGAYSEAVTWPAIVAAAPDVVVVAPCGYGLAGTVELLDDRALRAELAATPAGTAGQVWAVDASAYFVRPGPRLVDGVEILAGILHPDAWSPPAPDVAARLR
ncbi:MAG TPA: cobalamin-binding protein [Acidimicrobiia bacterium]